MKTGITGWGYRRRIPLFCSSRSFGLPFRVFCVFRGKSRLSSAPSLPSFPSATQSASSSNPLIHQSTNPLFCRAFTLIEMVGVLAVIAILSCVLVPKVFEAIHNASIAQVAIGLTTVKTACLGHFAKYGAMPVDGSTAPPTVLTPGTNQCLHFDQVLLVEGFLDKLFQVRIGESSIWLLPAAPANADPKDESAAFNLDGAGASNDAIGTLVVEAFITNVTLEDARALNRILDGESDVLGEDAGGNDLKGRVKYASPSGAAVGSGTGGGHGNGGGQGQGGIHGEGHQRGDRVEVHVYLGHK